MIRTFIDIGAHFGQSLEIAIDPKYSFDKILCFEPSSFAFLQLTRIRDGRVAYFPFGLGEREEKLTLFGSGELGGSVFADKVQKESHLQTSAEVILIKSAAKELKDFFEEASEVYIKMNCEGSEISILKNLLQHDLINDKVFLYVDFDIRKIPGLEYLAAEMQSMLIERGAQLSTPEDLGYGGAKGVRKWLDKFCAKRRVALKARVYYMFRCYQEPTLWFYRSITKLIPGAKKVAWFQIASRIGLTSWLRR